MQSYRTPDHCFAALEDYPFTPHYLEVDDTQGGSLRVHYVDEGPSDAAVVLLLHGEPTWSYVYRHIIPVLIAQGYRVIAPDLVGFGRSDKPARAEDYTVERHVGWMASVVNQLDLREAILIGHDWGGTIGLRVMSLYPECFAKAVAINTLLPLGKEVPPYNLLVWQDFARDVPFFSASGVVEMGTVNKVKASVLHAYDAPFPEECFKEGARCFPSLMPTSVDDPGAAVNAATIAYLGTCKKPFMTIFSDLDVVTLGDDSFLRGLIPGCAGQPHAMIKQAGHFVQEDKGEEVIQALLEFLARDTEQRERGAVR